MLTGRTAVITGASRGIGAATARALAATGARVALVARGADALHTLSAELAAKFGDGHLVAPADCTDAVDVAALAAAVTQWAHGAPDILVNSTGLYPRAPLHEQDPEQFAATLDVNLVAPFRVLRAFLPAMRARGSGDVITIGTVADRSIYPMNGAYSASKFGLRALHETLRAENRGTGIRATLVSPAAVDTAIWDAHAPGRDGLPPREAMLSAEDVADAVCWVLTRPAHVDVDELRLSRA